MDEGDWRVKLIKQSIGKSVQGARAPGLEGEQRDIVCGDLIDQVRAKSLEALKRQVWEVEETYKSLSRSR